MRAFLVPALLVAFVGCGGVDDMPLGGPYGGQTDPTDPNSTNNDNNNGQDSGTTNPQKDSGTTPQKDSGGPPPTMDSGGPPPTMDSGGPPPPTAPTWSQIYANYFGSGTIGRCNGCHSQGSSAKNLYSWLQGKGYISGTSSPLVDSSQSDLSWYGGNMPPGGGSSSKAVSDMNAWAAAGALDN